MVRGLVDLLILQSARLEGIIEAISKGELSILDLTSEYSKMVISDIFFTTLEIEMATDKEELNSKNVLFIMHALDKSAKVMHKLDSLISSLVSFERGE